MYFKMPFASTTSASICSDRRAAEVIMQVIVCDCINIFSSMIGGATLYQCVACVRDENDTKACVISKN